MAGQIRPGNPEWPRAWVSYSGGLDNLERDVADLKAHGVGLVEMGARDVAEARKALEISRRLKMKYSVSLPNVTWDASLVRKAGLQPVYALMIGGAYLGKAIDRHVFHFKAGFQQIVIEPPVYHVMYAYTDRDGRHLAHYYPEIPPPVRVEIVVPLRQFDGKQHLKILPAKVEEAPPDAKLEVDTVTAGVPETSETRSRRLYRVSFDLSGLGEAMLDKVGIAAYWEFHGAKGWYSLGNGTVTAAAVSTLETMRGVARRTLKLWTEANRGTFPLDAVLALRTGDECFYLTTHFLGQSPMTSYPLWDYCEPALQKFRAHAGAIEHPRTWGFPEIYGTDAYAWWLYTLHENAAESVHAIREEVAKAAPGLLMFRNTTRFGVFHKNNDLDGNGPELLTRQFDIVHLDPYPVAVEGMDKTVIPRDMSYYAGLARRYNRLLVPWMQAHEYAMNKLPPTPHHYPWLTHPSAEQVDLMAEQQWQQGVDAVLWLGYGRGNTFPLTRPDSWGRAAAFHKRLSDTPLPKPKATLAALRPYRTWALASQTDGLIRNPADWMLQQFLEVWAVAYGQSYDVFELAPRLSAGERASLDRELARYPHIVSTEPRRGAWVIGAGTEGRIVDPKTAETLQRRFESELVARGWLKGIRPQLPFSEPRLLFPPNW